MGLRTAALLAFALVLALFAVAALVEARARSMQRRTVLRRHAYTLALGVYCSSWTFYGAVGSTVSVGWNYLPIYLAPMLLLILAPRFLRRLAQAVADEQATSVSDFIAARFGHDIPVARLVTTIALLGTIPYIALQLRSIGHAMAIVSARDVAVPVMLVAACALALFAMLFGARRFELAGRSEGLVYAIGLESIIKLGALFAVAALAMVVLLGADAATTAREIALLSETFRPERLSIETAVIFLIATMAILVLPRQFYMGLVEAREPEDLVRARFGLAGYIGAMAVLVLPIALAGLIVLPAGTDPDVFVLLLPAARGNEWVLAAALLGGVSAAASMAIVDATALATMVSNDILLPSVLGRENDTQSGAIGRRALAIRRVSVFAIMFLALAWALLVSEAESLASIGLIGFAAMAQFTPHLILAALGTGRDPLPARISLATGLGFWLYTLALPPILPLPWIEWLAATPLDPLRLFAIGSATPLVHGVFWSLGANLATMALFSARTMSRPTLPRILRGQRNVSDVSELVQLTASFIGEERAQAEFPLARPGLPIDRFSAQRAQELIARVIGVSSARALVASALAGGKMSLHDVTRLLDEGGQSLRFSRQLLAATFENIDAGFSVVDADLNLVAWNSRYLEIFGYPAGMVRVGTPVADLIRHNARHGDFGPGDTEHHVAKRLEHLRRGQAHSFERRRKDGRVIKTVGGPMPGGGYVMSFTDITEDARVRAELTRTRDELEARVASRTHELSSANRRLAEADREKTRFLAAASHDLLQPLHAARLFAAALQREEAMTESPLVLRIEEAIIAAEDLLRALLDISKLDAGGVIPRPEPIVLERFLAEIVEGVRPQAEEKGLALRLAGAPGVLMADPGLLRSVMQNFVTNAVRYTPTGGVLVGVRRRAGHWRIDVVDTGVGIPEEKRETIFAEFSRIGEVEVDGLGLGLALVQRIARLLGGTIEVASRPGHGSRFSLLLPATDVLDAPERATVPAVARAGGRPGPSLRVLVVDNDSRIVEATMTLLASMGHRGIGATSIGAALDRVGTVDAVLADYRLDDDEDGLSLIALLRQRRPDLPALVITASTEPGLAERADALEVQVLAKPADPAAIERFLRGLSELV
ncbi:PAS-domain containing protein [Novosphingobium album (ex Liu et al. 2023)]|uniref:histidine kinase n=1 Tax=Novosphingobium album (ex Liu et al. 2023) TaxID=3031130 RepID=A0ABT5WVF9_9SPHN|nr:PAS-domain containing protein [Novosphingobium album (ex Liu et al. 2023)]MDE8653889.1 PAS-domain containing protein [Novosphingobium album (ex Liu et al. 2023)]